MTLHLAQKQNEFNRLNKAISELYHDISVQIGISDSIFDIFYAIIALGDGCCQRDICNYAFTGKQTIHSAIHKLEKEEFLCLKSGKGRERHIFLTAKGKHFIEEKIAPVIVMENKTCSRMNAEELDTLLLLTEKYFDCLRAQAKELPFYKNKINMQSKS
ncbi:MAG: MarR family transcriptional regulator [Lachnospiraceae bacterium]|nr:MarR family transcriptional regulator [Lachnospiraceae bacterium]